MYRIGRALLGIAIATGVALGVATPASQAAGTGTVVWDPSYIAPQLSANGTGWGLVNVAGTGFTPGGAVDVTSYYFDGSSWTPTSATDRVTAAPYIQLCFIGQPCGPQAAPGSFAAVLLPCSGANVTNYVYAYDERARVGIGAWVDPAVYCL
jgi:hypothetical protein